MDSVGRILGDDSVTRNVTNTTDMCHYIDILTDDNDSLRCKDTIFLLKVLFYSKNMLTLPQIY